MTQPRRKSALISTILTVGGSIGLLAISLLTFLSSNVVSSAPAGRMTYTGYEDKTEVVNKLQFAQKNNQYDAGIVSEMYAGDDTTLILTSNPLVADPTGGSGNVLESDVNSQILGGAGIQVGSDNITVLGGSGVKVSEGNDNATVLGGLGNELSGSVGGSTPSVLVGGADNKILDSEGGVIVGGSGNKISGGSNSQILGGEGNEVNVDNAMVAGSNVKNTGASNSFVFSDGEDGTFSPATSGAFYINTKMGLGLNAGANSGSITSAGGVKVGYIDIENNTCNSDNIGVQGTYNGCLVGCTTGSSLSGRWDLLEISVNCINWCDSSSLCMDTIKKEYVPYTGFCNLDSLGELRDTADQCILPGINPDKYKDVVFDVDFVDVCPSLNSETLSKLANPCIYKCPEGYTADGGSCKASCDFGGKTLLHGETKLGYAKVIVECTEGKTCSDYEIIAQCVNGHVNYAAKPGIIATSPSDIAGYNCVLSGAICPAEYKFTSTGSIPGGIFSGCTEYTSVGNTQCNTTTKYQLVGCESGYTKKEGEDICLVGCKIPWSTTGLTVSYGTVVTGFHQEVISCDSYGEETSCDKLSDTLKCGENGVWIGDADYYSKGSCRVGAVDTPSEYNLTECPKAHVADGTVVVGKIPEGTEIGHCTMVTGYTVSGNQVCQVYNRYRLDSCIEGYSRSGDTCLPRCIVPWSTVTLNYNTGGTEETNKALWSGNSIIYRAQIKGYKTGSRDCPIPLATGSSDHLKGCESSDNWTMMTCGTGGVLGGRDTYIYKECDSQPLPYPEEYNRLQPVEHAICTGFQPYSVDDNMCKEEHMRYKCTRCDTGYTLNGDISKLVGGDTTAQCLADCTFNISPSGTYTLSGFSGSRLFYNPYGYTCPDSYKSGEALFTCYNGKLTTNNSNVATGSKPYTGYNQTALHPSQLIVDDGTQTGIRTIVKSGNTAHGVANSDPVDVSSRINISPYTTYFPYYSVGTNPVCKLVNTYYYLKCKADTNTTDRDGDNSYVWPASSTNVCVRCEGSVPENAHRNNATFPTSTTSPSFHYTTTASEICGFSCNDGYFWTGGACMSYYCNLDNGSNKMIHTTEKTIYKPSSNPICNTECEAIDAVCLYGEWRDKTTNALIEDAFSTCSTRNGYVVNYPSVQAPVAGSYSPATTTYQRLLTSQPANTTLIERATNYIANDKTCTIGSTGYKVECPSANYYWTTSNLCQKYCVANGNKYTSGQTITTYAAANPECPTACSTVTATCKSNGNWNRTINASCSTQTSSTCTSSFTLTSKSDSNGLYAECSAASGEGCYPKYNLTGCKAGYTLYNGGCYKNCTLDGQGVLYNGTGRWYTTSRTCVDDGGCEAMILQCTGTDKNNTYLVKNGTTTRVSTGFSACSETCLNCEGTQWGTVLHGQILNGPKTGSVQCPNLCQYGYVACWDGVLSGNLSAYYASCTLIDKDTCAAGTTTRKRVLNQTISDSHASLVDTCTASIADNVNGDCSTGTYRYYECSNGYSWSGTTCVPSEPSCGSAAGTTSSYCRSSKPTSNLCSIGSNSTVSTSTTGYTWTCSIDGKSVSCSAPRYSSCGSADDSSYSNAPSSNLCSIGSASSVTTNTSTYTWTCTNSPCSAASCSACKSPSCGSANGGSYAYSNAPSSNLCSIGSASSVTTNTSTYTWKCTNTCGGSTNCSATRQGCDDSCPSGKYKSCSCGGTAYSTNECGNTCYTCTASPKCGSANGGQYDSAPSSYLCSVGTPSAVTTNSSTYSWTCTNGTCSVGCSASMPGGCTTADGYAVGHNTTDTYYKAGSVTCTSASDKCQTWSLKCDNGTFYNGSTAVSSSSVYKYCSTSDGACSIASTYPLTSVSGISSRCNTGGPKNCYSSDGSQGCKISYTGYNITSAKAGYYVNSSRTDCLAICPSGTVADPYCNDGSTPSGYDGATYKNAYSYKCGSATCNVNCPSNQVWHGSSLGCGKINNACVNKSTDATDSDAYKCNPSGLTAGNKSNVNKGYFRKCQDGDGNGIGDTCHACKAGYVRSESDNDCVMKELCNTSTNPGSCYYGSASDYTTTEWWKSTYYRKCTFDGVTKSCSTKCADNQVYHGGSVKKCETIDACSTTKFECKQGMPLDFATGSTAYTWKCWDSSHSNVLGNCSVAASFSCQGSYPEHSIIYTGTVTSNRNWNYSSTLSGYCVFKCDTGYTYNYKGYHVCECSNNTCGNGAYLTCPSSLPYTGSLVYTNSCGNGCYTCYDNNDIATCGTKPTVLKYAGVTPNWTYLSRNGGTWHSVYDCTCNKSTKKRECSSQFGSLMCYYQSYSSVASPSTGGMVLYDGSRWNGYNNTTSIAFGDCGYQGGSDPNFNSRAIWDIVHTVGSSSAFDVCQDSENIARMCTYHCNVPYGGTCNDTCWVYFGCKRPQNGPTSYYECNGAFKLTCSSGTTNG